MKRTNILWIAALALGWLFDFLFWKHTPGINFAIYTVLCLAGGFLVIGLNGVKASWKTLLLVIPILFFAVMTFIRAEGMTVFLSVLFVLTLMGVLAASLTGGRWLLYSLSDYVVNIALLVVSMIARPIIFLTENKKQAETEGTVADIAAARRSGWKRVWAILRGLLIALPIVAIFAALLSSADLVFAQRMDDFIKLFRLEKLPEYMFRVFYIFVFAYALAGVILHAAQKSKNEKLVGQEKPLVPQFLGFTEAAVVLGAVVALFGLFVVIQFQYFFGGQTNIGLEGYTYAEYARKGFGELVAVAFFSLLLLMGLSGIVKRQNLAQRWTFSGLGIGMVALIGVMLVSAFKRLVLYETVYGFTRLRAYTHVFMIWLAVLLAVVVVLDILRKERAFALACMLASIGFAASLALINVDGFIVRHNVARAVQGEDLDAGYLASLTYDAVPGLADALQDESLPADTRDAVGAALACWVNRSTSEPDTNWRSFTLTRLQAEKALEDVQGILDNYTIHDEEWPPRAETPQGESYDCWTDWMD